MVQFNVNCAISTDPSSEKEKEYRACAMTNWVRGKLPQDEWDEQYSDFFNQKELEYIYMIPRGNP